MKKPTVMGKPVGIVRKTIHNNHGTKLRNQAVEEEYTKKPYISKTAFVSNLCRIPKFPL